MACVLLTYMALDLFRDALGIILRVEAWLKRALFVAKKQRSSATTVAMSIALTMP